MFEGRAMEYRQIQIIGGQGNAPGRFATTLRGLAVDAHGQLYAAGDSGITVFDQAGSVKRRWATSRPPLSVAVASDGAVYAGEERQIEIFDGAGKLVNTWRDDALLGRVTAIGFVKDGVVGGGGAERGDHRRPRPPAGAAPRRGLRKGGRVGGVPRAPPPPPLRPRPPRPTRRP